MINIIYSRIALLFFFLMLVIPTTFQVERGILLLFLIIGVAVNSVVDQWRVHKSILLIGLVNVTASVMFILWGVLNDAPGAISVTTVYVFWPVLFIYFMGALHRPSDFHLFMKTIILGVICSSLMGVMLVMYGVGFISIDLEQHLAFQGASVGVYDGFIEYQLYNLTTVMFGFGYLLTCLMLGTELKRLDRFWQNMVLAAFVLACLALLFSGRRAFWVVAAMSPFVIYSLTSAAGLKTTIGKKSGVYGILLLAILAGCFFLIEIDIQSMYDNFIMGFEFDNSENESGALRKEQFAALYNGWVGSPLIGHGHGSFSFQSVRDMDSPWAYELSYVALLFQVGLLGFSVLAFSIIWLFGSSVRMVRRFPDAAILLLPLLVGLCCLLVANATNPYIAKFDYLWVIFLPIAVLNAYLVRTR